MAINTKIQLRRDTLQNWHQQNPVLASGEIALVDKNNGVGDKLWVLRIGDGTTHFDDLPEMAYAIGSELGDLELSVSEISTQVSNEITTRQNQVDTLSAEISAKVKVENVPVQYINISRVDAETYHQIVGGGTADQNTVYIVSSDNINAFGERIINVGDAVDVSDAVNLKQLNAVESSLTSAISSISSSITGVVDAVSDVVVVVSADLYGLSGKFESLDDSLSDYVVDVEALGRTGDVLKYQLKQGGENVGQPLEVPYDVFVDKGQIRTVDDKKYLVLTLNNSTSTELSIETTDLVDVYTAVDSDTIDMDVNGYQISGFVKDASITTAKLALSAVTSDRITHDAVTNDKIADDAIQTENILDNSVTPAKLYQDGLFVFDCGNASSNEG